MISKHGFTLVELLVTIAVIAIVTAMAVPSFSAILARQRLNRDIKDVTEQLAKARTQAILLRSQTAFCFDKGTDGAVVSIATCASNITAYSSASTADKTQIEKNRVFMATTSSQNNVKTGSSTTLTFSANGIASSSATFSLCKDSIMSRTISVTVTGIITKSESSSC